MEDTTTTARAIDNAAATEGGDEDNSGSDSNQQQQRGHRRGRPRRRQSRLRLKYKITSAKRIDDIPNCPASDELFGEGDDDHHIVDSTVSMEGVDPLETILGPEALRGGGLLQQPEAAGPSRKSVSDSSFITAVSTTPTPFRRHPPHRHASCSTTTREIKLALKHTRKPCSHMWTSHNGSASQDHGSFLSWPSDPSSSSGDNDDDGDDFDCCLQLWNLLVNLMMLLIRLFNFVLDNKILLYPLAFFLCYLSLGLLHKVAASIMATLTGLIWPPTHIFLNSSAGFVWRLADWLSWVDALGRSMVCDMAANYCRRYQLLCDRQCSFVDRTMEHAHTGRCF